MVQTTTNHCVLNYCKDTIGATGYTLNYLCQPQNGEISTKKIQYVRKYLDKHLINFCIFRVLNMFKVCNVTNMTVF